MNICRRGTVVIMELQYNRKMQLIFNINNATINFCNNTDL